jgi:hypothetical protein
MKSQRILVKCCWILVVIFPTLKWKEHFRRCIVRVSFRISATTTKTYLWKETCKYIARYAFLCVFATLWHSSHPLKNVSHIMFACYFSCFICRLSFFAGHFQKKSPVIFFESFDFKSIVLPPSLSLPWNTLHVCSLRAAKQWLQHAS